MSLRNETDILENIPFLRELSNSEIQNIEQNLVKKRARGNEVVLHEKDTARYAYIVFQGKVRAVQYSYDGREQTLAIHKRGDFFGEMALLDGNTVPASIIAMEDSLIGLLAKSTFEKFVLQNEKSIRCLMIMLSQRLRDAWLMLKVLGYADAEQRVRALLHHLSQIYGIRDRRGVIVTIKLTHKEIASYASLSRETVTRLLKKMSETGEIDFLEKRQIILTSQFFERIEFL